MKEYIIRKKDSNQRVDKYIARILPKANKSFIYKMMRKKNITLNDHKIQGNEILKENDAIKIWFSDQTFDSFSGSDNHLTDTTEYNKAYSKLENIIIIYEDDDFIVLDKPAGILSQKSKPDDISLNEWLIGYLLSKNEISAQSLVSVKPSIANRLDRNTSGLVLCGKTVFGLTILNKLIKERSIKKIYHAYILGELKGDSVLEAYHFKNNDTNEVEILNEKQYQNLSNDKKQKFSKIQTGYRAITSSYNQTINNKITFVEVDLITGKTHQIRAHMAHIGHPLIGDNKYGNKNINSLLHIKSQLLHAYRLDFPVDDSIGSLSGQTFTSINDIKLEERKV